MICDQCGQEFFPEDGTYIGPAEATAQTASRCDPWQDWACVCFDCNNPQPKDVTYEDLKE